MAERLLEAPSDPKAAKPAVEPNPDAALRLLCWVGALVGLVGWMDVLLLWFPLRFGTAEWEFGTASSTFDALPLGTIGFALLAAAAVAKGWRWASAVAGWVALGLAFVLLAVLLLFALDAPLAWKGVTAAYLPVLKKAMFKTVVSAVAYIGLYAVTGVLTLRLAQRFKGVR